MAKGRTFPRRSCSWASVGTSSSLLARAMSRNACSHVGSTWITRLSIGGGSKYSPPREEAFRRRKRLVWISWRMHETSITVQGQCYALEGAGEKTGQTIDCLLTAQCDAHDATRFLPKSAEKPRHACRGWIGVGRAGLNAQEPNKTHAVPEPSMGEGTAEREAPACMPGRTSLESHSCICLRRHRG